MANVVAGTEPPALAIEEENAAVQTDTVASPFSTASVGTVTKSLESAGRVFLRHILEARICKRI
jgi:hypothetical protein